MTHTVFLQDVAIRRAARAGTLAIERRVCRVLGEAYWALRDEHGLIEVALSEREAEEKVRKACRPAGARSG